MKLEKDDWVDKKADQLNDSLAHGDIAALHSGIASLTGRSKRSQKQGLRSAGIDGTPASCYQEERVFVQQHFSQLR